MPSKTRAPFFPNMLPSKSPPRKQPVPKEKKAEFSGTILEKIRLIEDERDRFQEELKKRAAHFSDLCAMSMALRVVLTRLQNGAFTESDHKTVEPPLIFKLGPKGCDNAFEYIRTSLSMMRPAIVSLYNNHLKTSEELAILNAALGAFNLVNTDEIDEQDLPGIEYGETRALLEGIE